MSAGLRSWAISAVKLRSAQPRCPRGTIRLRARDCQHLKYAHFLSHASEPNIDDVLSGREIRNWVILGCVQENRRCTPLPTAIDHQPMPSQVGKNSIYVSEALCCSRSTKHYSRTRIPLQAVLSHLESFLKLQGTSAFSKSSALYAVNTSCEKRLKDLLIKLQKPLPRLRKPLSSWTVSRGPFHPRSMEKPRITCINMHKCMGSIVYPELISPAEHLLKDRMGDKTNHKVRDLQVKDCNGEPCRLRHLGRIFWN